MNILIRADASNTIGTGHIMRDLILAHELKKQYPHAKILFATRNLAGNINHKILEAGYTIHTLHSHAKDELLECMQKFQTNMLVIDHYKIDYAYESFLKNNSEAKILVFDDTYVQHNCDILLNHNISADEKKYKNLLPQGCELRCGAKYTLLREEFTEQKAKQKALKNFHKKMNILVALGGTDNFNLNIKILELLKGFKNIQVHLITTTANKNLKKLQNYAKSKKFAKLHINTNQMAQKMAEADLGIITPSVSANEAYFMNLDFIAIKIVSNQNAMYKYLKRKRFKTLDKFNKRGLKCHLMKAGKNKSIHKINI
ncbi:UDP-2,4-diacetamido-2,4,6-trideoxy-beta-L-altropyranose hydrolase [bacterium]|nr:UDP-2,4-diacetamido-2,4,6-trideoxy-beta-L-altropyranose hydrolase [bacterium]MBU1994471.1 UDP-2,4-diacetamido-2,4,6-trideoxy-beta-L-altropyranose hydrolase [bacterium]